MLVLTRRVGESVQVDGPCRVTVVRFKGSQMVELGFEADRSTQIVRDELRKYTRTERIRERTPR